MRRIFTSSWFIWTITIALTGLGFWGQTSDDAPKWATWLSSVLVILVVIWPGAELFVWHSIAVRRGLIQRSRLPYIVTLVDQSVIVEHGKRRTRCDLPRVSRARRAVNGNWTESTMLEDALGLFSAKGKEIVRVPLSAAGLDTILRELESRSIPVDDVEVSAPVYLD